MMDALVAGSWMSTQRRYTVCGGMFSSRPCPSSVRQSMNPNRLMKMRWFRASAEVDWAESQL